MQTLLEMVKDVLSDLISDEITSINDSAESLAVATMFRRVYYELAAHMDLPENEALFNLTQSSTGTTPCVMYRPDNVRSIEWVRFDKSTATATSLKYTPIKWKPVKDFVDDMQMLSQTSTTVGNMSLTLNGSTFTFLFKNDRHPSYYTTLDDNTYIFDAYTATLGPVLQSSRTLVSGTISNTFTLSDTFIPAMDEQHMPLLVATVAERAFDLLKDRIPITINKSQRRLKVSAQRTKRDVTVKQANEMPNYGRNRR